MSAVKNTYCACWLTYSHKQSRAIINVISCTCASLAMSDNVCCDKVILNLTVRSLLPHLNTNVVHPSRLVLLQEASNWTLLPQRMEQLQLSVTELHKHSVDSVLGQRHLVTHRSPQHVPIQSCGLLHVRDGDGNVVQPPQLPQ